MAIANTLESRAAAYLECQLLDAKSSADLRNDYIDICNTFGSLETDSVVERIRSEMRVVLHKYILTS
jgi:hypothetical protein